MIDGHYCSWFDELTSLKGKLEHRRVKRFYARTNKLQFERQIARHQLRERVLRKIHLRSEAVKANGQAASSSDNKPKAATVPFEGSDPLPYTMPTAHYHVSEATRHPENITAWLATNQGDPATKVHMFNVIEFHFIFQYCRTFSHD